MYNRLMKQIIYETERLIIRKWQKKDLRDCFEIVSDDNVTKFLSFKTCKTYKETKERLDKLLAEYKAEPVKAHYAIELKKENKVIGEITIGSYKPTAEGVMEVGYMLSAHYQGKGYMTEALVGMFKYVKKNKIAKRIEAMHDVENFKSGNVMKRAGMTFEGIKRKEGQNNTNTRCDTAMYSILFEEIED